MPSLNQFLPPDLPRIKQRGLLFRLSSTDHVPSHQMANSPRSRDPRGDARCPSPARVQRQLRTPAHPAEQVPKRDVVCPVEVLGESMLFQRRGKSPEQGRRTKTKQREMGKSGQQIGRRKKKTKYVWLTCAIGRATWLRKVPIRRVQEEGGQDGRVKGIKGRGANQLGRFFFSFFS